MLANKPQSSYINHQSDILRQAWRLLMENHPHDSICGCSIDQVHAEMKVRFDQVDQIGEELTRQSLEMLAANIQTESAIGQSALVVFNPTSTPRTDVVHATLDLPTGVNEFDLVDENGVTHPYQTHGLGSREIIRMTLDVKGFKSAFGSINAGRAAGMAIQDIKIRRENTDVFIEAIMADGGEPNLTAWNAGRKQIEEFLADPSITTYHVVACSVSATQIVLTAAEVPSLGYQTLWVRARAGVEKAPIRIGPLVKAFAAFGETATPAETGNPQTVSQAAVQDRE